MSYMNPMAFLGVGAGAMFGQQAVMGRANRDEYQAYQCGGPMAANSILGEEQSGITGGNMGSMIGSMAGGMSGGLLGSLAGGFLGGAVGQSLGKLFGHNSNPYGNQGGCCPGFQGGQGCFNSGGYGQNNYGGGGQYFGGGNCGCWPPQGGGFGQGGAQQSEINQLQQMVQMQQQEIQQLAQQQQGGGYGCGGSGSGGGISSQGGGSGYGGGGCPPYSGGGGCNPGQTFYNGGGGYQNGYQQGYQQGLQYGQNQPWSGGNCNPSQGCPTSGSGTNGGGQGQVIQANQGQPMDVTTPGGWKVDVSGSTITLTDPSGKHTVQEWGDPHENVDGQTDNTGSTTGHWNTATRTLSLPDGTTITMNAPQNNTTIASTSITMNGRQVNYDNNTNTITSQTFDPRQTAQNQANQSLGQVVSVSENSQGLSVANQFIQNSPGGNITRDYAQLAFSPSSYPQASALNNPAEWAANNQAQKGVWINGNT